MRSPWFTHVTVNRVLLVVACLCSWLIGYLGSDPDYNWTDFGTNVVSEMIGVIFTVGLIAWIARSHEEHKTAKSDAYLSVMAGVKIRKAAVATAKAFVSEKQATEMAAARKLWKEAATEIDDVLERFGPMLTPHTRVYWRATREVCETIHQRPLTDEESCCVFWRAAIDCLESSSDLWEKGGAPSFREDPALDTAQVLYRQFLDKASGETMRALIKRERAK